MSARKVKARDVMSTEVATLSPDDSIETAMALFDDAGISGAPVMGPDRSLIGVLSRSDVARSEHIDGDRIGERGRGRERSEDFDAEQVVYGAEDYSPEVLGRTRVADWMTPSVVTVAPDESLQAVCRKMSEGALHRVFVTERGQLVGVVSSLDVVRWVARSD